MGSVIRERGRIVEGFDMSDNTRRCGGCDSVIVPGPRERNKKKWCSEACRVRAYRASNPDKCELQKKRGREREAAKRAAKGPYPKCLNCVRPLKSRRDNFKYCNRPECQAVRKKCSATSGAKCSIGACSRPSIARGLCGSHYVLEWRRMNPEKAAAINHRRRALKRDAFVEDVDLIVVLERDKWICGLCGEKIPKNAKFPHSSYRTMDHILPLALGGLHSYANVQAAHYGCNSAKGSRGGGEQLALI